MPINTIHPAHKINSPLWDKCRDAYEGQEAMKSGREKYLPKLNGQDNYSYDSYLDRATYVNFTRRTVETAIGQIFRKDPVISGLDELLIDDIDLNGTSIMTLSKQILRELLLVNRVGILVDYSKQLDIPYLVMFEATSIINWRVSNIQGRNQLSLVVLQGTEKLLDGSDIYEQKTRPKWLVLELEAETGYFVLREYVQASKDGEFQKIQEMYPMMNGKKLTHIPFYMITSSGITETIEKAPLIDFVNLNIAHYKNSADFENLLHWTGAKTVIAKGWGDKPFPIGGAAVMPVDGDCYFLEASSDSGLKDELQAKEGRMAVLGSSLISGKGRYVASAETQKLTSAGEYATLSDIANSLSDSMTAILQMLGFWGGQNPDDISISYNTDFEMAELNTQDLISLMGAVQSGMMSWETYYYQLKSREVYPDGWSIEDERNAIGKELADLMARRVPDEAAEEEEEETEEIKETE